ncbi:MAG TPA: TRAP transporter small permease [Burkholderiaceae bacterium]|nr:TRAP transporter small permease [Burkholderiaceae bacterium]
MRSRFPVAIEEVLAVACMALLVLITLVNVIVRYLTQHSVAATEEISVFLMIVMTLAGATAAAARDRHIRIEYFYQTGSWRRRRGLALFAAAATAAFFIVLAWLSGRVVWDEFRYAETTMALGLPRWWYTIWVPVLCVALALRAIGVAAAVAAGGLSPAQHVDDSGAGAGTVADTGAAPAAAARIERPPRE